NLEEREKVALDATHDGKITVYFRYGGVDFSCATTPCTEKAAQKSFSSRAGHYVAMFGWNTSATLLAHELGHYLWNSHTFWSQPQTLDDVRQTIKDWVEGATPHPKSEALNAFDGDLRSGDAADTPPDPGAAFWKTVKGDACATGPGADTQEVTVTF